MASYVYWMIAAFLLLAAEMLTGTLYLLVIALGAAAGGTAAWLGTGSALQFIVVAVICLAGVGLLNRWKATQRASQTPEQSLDVGATVQVETWNPDGSARVHYRGTLWDARLDSPDTPRAEVLYVKNTDGSTLILTNRKT